MKTFSERVAQGDILISDGAIGTLLQAKGLQPGECPESWCVSHPDILLGIHAAYCAAGSDLVETNSFGGTCYKLKPYGLEEKVEEYNKAAVALVKQAVAGRGYVLASLGPTGRIAEDEGGDVTPQDLYNAFKQQVMALDEGGPDAFCIETMASGIEACQAVRACKENARIPVICTFTFEASPRGFRTMMGLTPERAAREAVAAGADLVGANCGNGIVNMIEVARQMRAAQPETPIVIQANAGTPVLEGGKTVFKETPEFMASKVPDLINSGAQIIGGCCGTTPDHIAAIAKAARAHHDSRA